MKNLELIFKITLVGLLAFVLTNCTKDEEFIPDRTKFSEIELPKLKSGFVSDLLTLKNDIDSIASTEPMNPGNINSLKIKIDNAIKSLEKGNKTAALNQLKSLINQVEGFIKAGLCSEGQGQAFIYYTTEVIELIETPLSPFLAYYPLIKDTKDATGNYPDIIVKNCMFSKGGIFSNGKYILDDPEGSLIQTPLISGLNLNDFEVSVDFKVTDPDFYYYKPVFIIGNLYREFGFLLNSDQTVSLLLGNSHKYDSDQQFLLNRWQNARIEYNGDTAKMYLDNNLVISEPFVVSMPSYDKVISNTNFGNATTFKGYWKNLIIK